MNPQFRSSLRSILIISTIALTRVSGAGEDLTDPFSAPPEYFVSGPGVRVVAYEPRFTDTVLALQGAVSEEPAKTPEAAVAAGPFEPFENGTDPATVTPALLGKQMTLTGVIAKYETSPNDRTPYKLTLVDREESPVMIVYWPDAASRIHGSDGREPSEGLRVSVRGALSDYRGVLQVRVSNPNNIRIEGFAPSGPTTEKKAAALKSLGKVDPSRVTVADALEMEPGSGVINVFGEVVSYRPAWSDRSPNTLTITDGEQELAIVFFPNEIADLAEEFKTPGAAVRVRGVRSDYQGKKQLRIKTADSVVSAAVAEAEAAKAAAAVKEAGGTGTGPEVITSVGLTRAHEGKDLAVLGTVSRVNATPSGSYVVLKDDDGVVVAFLNPELASDEGLKTLLAEGKSLVVAGKGEFSRLRSQMILRVESAASIREME